MRQLPSWIGIPGRNSVRYCCKASPPKDYGYSPADHLTHPGLRGRFAPVTFSA